MATNALDVSFCKFASGLCTGWGFQGEGLHRFILRIYVFDVRSIICKEWGFQAAVKLFCVLKFGVDVPL